METYLAELERGELEPDAAQRRAVEHTQRLYEKLIETSPRPRGFLRGLGRLIGGARLEPVRGLYIWGGVGRGKTHIVNALHAALPFPDKMRVHFHGFMQTVHGKLRNLGERRDLRIGEPRPLRVERTRGAVPAEQVLGVVVLRRGRTGE